MNLAAKLDELRALDTGFRVFGASSHRYRTQPVTEAELIDVETALGVPLPADFRAVLRDIGTGAGPSYGLYGVDHYLHEPKDRATSAPFPLTRADVEAFRRGPAQHRFGNGKKAIELDFEAPGCLEICHHGCGSVSFLVLTGELAGTVWDFWEGLWAPVGSSFGEWYGEWLNKGLFDVS